jgi:hypothetical protein
MHMGSKTRLPGLLGLVGLLAAGPDAGATSVISNGSFELPALTFNIYYIRNATNPTGWSRTGGSIAWFSNLSNFNPSDGRQFLELEGFTAELYQSFPTTAGAEYTVSFDFAPSGYTSGVDDAVSVRIDGIERLYIDEATTVNTPLAWIRRSFTFVATSSSTELRFVDGGPVNGINGGFLDNVTVEPTVDPLALKLSLATVAGCKSVTGTVTLPAPAPAGGKIVTIADTLASATAPVSVAFAAGESKKTFPLKTTEVLVLESGLVSATLDGFTVSQALSVRPIGMLSLAYKPSPVTGGNAVIGTAKLECKAALGPIEVALESNNPAVANPVAMNVFVPQGLQSATFDITTSPVLAKTTARISGTANGITKSKVLTVIPAASVSPTSLKFGNVVVGTTSPVLNTTLQNKGTASFALAGISLTGTAAALFAQSNDCPATLAAGASCTIGVTFSPTVTGAKSAKLSIATSATAAPLSVSLSGTGVLPP